MSLAKDSLLVYIPTPPPDGWLDDMMETFPGLRARWILQPMGSDGRYLDANDIPSELYEGVTLLLTYHSPRAELIPDVRFVQLASAGSDLWKTNAKYLDPNVPFANASGCSAPQLAEWVIGSWLSHLHRFNVLAELQRKEEWSDQTDFGISDSYGCRMGILGYGAIGRQCARHAQSLGMEVYAYTGSPRPTPESRRDDTFCLPNSGDPEGLIPAKWFSGSNDEGALSEFLGSGLDVLVICAPLTDASRGLIGAKQFEILSSNKGKTFLINVARGPIVQTNALIEALEKGMIRGAALDVTDPEPLPKGHPLWKAPNVTITPHCAWQSANYRNVMTRLLKDNLTRLAEGRPLLNLDKKTL